MFRIFTVLVLALCLAIQLPSFAEESPILGIPFQDIETQNQKVVRGKYILPTDSCYQKYLSLGGYSKRKFASAQEAENSGFVHEVYGIKELGKFCDVCSELYEYFRSPGSCVKIEFSNSKAASDAGFLEIDRFEVLSYEGKVLAFDKSKIYHTTCDYEYACLSSLLEGWKPLSCNRGMEQTPIAVFDTEGEARASGYISFHEYLLSEFDDGNSK